MVERTMSKNKKIPPVAISLKMGVWGKKAFFLKKVSSPTRKNQKQPKKENAMIPLIVIISIVTVIAFLLSIKITLKIRYKDKLEIDLKVFFIKIKSYPTREKSKGYRHSMSKRKARKIKDSLEKKPKKIKKKKKEKNGKQKEEDKPDAASIISIMLSFVKNFVSLFARAIRVKASRIKITVASEDAAQTALTYAAVTQSINVLFPLLDGLKTVKKLPHGKELSVNADFLSEEPTYDIDIELYARISGILSALCRSAFRAFKKAVKNEIKKLENKR